MGVLRFALFLIFSSCLLQAAEPRIVKVLPHLLDDQGRHSLAPSLYERDAYQVELRTNPDRIHALRFDIQWKAPRKSGKYTLRLELRGAKTGLVHPRVFETEVVRDGWFSTWSSILLDKKTYAETGAISAWRATLWKDGKQVASEESFLW